MTYIVAIAAPPGGGKSSLVKALTATVPDSAALAFDGYEQATGRPVDEIVREMTAGTDFTNFVSPALTRDLAALKQDRTIIDPLSGQRVMPGKYVFFEMPLGRAHGPTAGFIDLVIWIDVPLDLALARKLRDFTAHCLRGDHAGDTAEFVRWLDGYLVNYIRGVRQTLLFQRQWVRANADIRVDGMAAAEAIANKLAPEIRARLP